MKKIYVITLTITILLTSIMGTFAANAESNYNSEDALKLINEKIALEMQQNNLSNKDYKNKTNEITKKLENIGVEKMNDSDLSLFLSNTASEADADILLDTISRENGSALNIMSDEPPCPAGNSKIDFYWFRTFVEDIWVYSVIAAPVENSKQIGRAHV